MPAPATAPRKPRLTDDGTRYARIVGQNIAIRRKHHGLTQAQLAAAMTTAGCPMSANVIAFTEIGQTGGRANTRPRNVSVDHLMAFAEFFGCDPMALLVPACETCEGVPPAGFTCDTCGTSMPRPTGE
jgi:hypothetical protein